MAGKVVFFKGVYDTLDLYTDEFVRIFTEKGYETLVIHTDCMEKSLKQLGKFMEDAPVDAVITFNNIGFDMELANEKNIWEELQIPCINILMDHPFHYDKALKHAPQNAILLCMDENHVEYVKRFYPNIGHVGFLPHAGIELARNHRPLYERDIQVLYAGGLSKYVAQGLIPDLSSIIEFDALALSQYALQELAEHPQKTTEEVIEVYLQKLGLNYDDEKLHQTICQMRFLDSFAVSFYREQSVRILVENGIPVTVYGAGWEQCEWADNPNLTLGGKIPAPQILAKMNDAKIVLNTMTWFKKGAHDRIFNGMLAGAVVVTDESDYLQKYVASDREMEIFALPEITKLPRLVKTLLEDGDRAQRIADCGYHYAKMHDMWINRIDEIILPLLEGTCC